MKIKPLGNLIQIKIEEVKAGVLDTSSRDSAIEFGEVVGIGPKVTLDVKKGDKVFVKAWGIDIVKHNDKAYHFISEDTNAILAVVS